MDPNRTRSNLATAPTMRRALHEAFAIDLAEDHREGADSNLDDHDWQTALDDHERQLP